jgi:GAF domain-containing protein
MITPMVTRLRAQRTLDSALETILNDVIALHGAEFGNIQLAVDGSLRLVGHHGLQRQHLDLFHRVDKDAGTACARAFRSGKPVVIPDVEEDAEFAPFAAAAQSIGFRSVQSTPLMAADGSCVGVVSTHFVNKHVPTAIEMNALADYGKIAADHLAELWTGENVAAHAERLFDAMITRTAPRRRFA